MRTPYKLPELEQEYDDFEREFLRMVNSYGQAETARRLGVSQPTVSQWLSDMGYKRVSRYEKIVEESAS